MRASNGTINFFQACTILMLTNGLTNHVIVNPMLLDASGRDSWIAVIAAGLLFVPWCFLLALFIRKTDQMELRSWLAAKTNRYVAWALAIPLCIQIYLIGAMTVIHSATWTITNYLPGTPKTVLAIVLTGLCALYASWGIRVIAIMSGVLLPLVILLGTFAGVSNYPQKDFHLLQPYLEFGLDPVVQGMVYAGGGFIEIVVLIAMQQHIKTRIKPWHVILYASLMVYIMLGPLIGAITEFGPSEAAKQMVSPYEQWRLVKLGSYVEHVDFFSIYQWLAGACVRISLSIFLVLDLLRIRRNAMRNRIIMLIALSYVALSVFPIDAYAFYLWMYRLYFPISLAAAFAVSFCWMSISWFAKPVKGGAA
ncbi:endospore germination permease [Cohnella cellulosilytica]|uniref:Endospore germination permease n=1 Tax=Cohnella cellulosilytica TaxID=986710 RepID=A0ABW2F4X3_9BACL